MREKHLDDLIRANGDISEHLRDNSYAESNYAIFTRWINCRIGVETLL